MTILFIYLIILMIIYLHVVVLQTHIITNLIKYLFIVFIFIENLTHRKHLQCIL